MSTPLNVLILEDEPSDVDLVLYELRRAGFNPHWQRVETAVEFTNHLSDKPDLILADYSLPQFDALSALKILQENDLDIPFIVVTGSLEEMALECMKQGADDYLLKGHLPRLGPAVQYALRQKQMRVQKQQADQALRESEARYRLLFENNLAAVFRTTLNGRILDCNQAYADILGYSSRSEIQTHSAQAFYPETSDRSDFLQTLQAQKAVRNYEMQLRRKDGRLIWVVENVSLLEGEQGEPVIQGTLMDITAAKQTEAALRASERRFRALVENSSDAVALLDTEGAIRYVTPSISRILGYEVQEFVGRPAFDLLDPPTREYLLQGAFARFLKEPAKSELAEYRVRHKNGSWRWIENIVTNLLDDPDVAAVVCNFRDITDRKRREREREALLTVASVLRTATTRKEMLPALLEQLSDLLDADGVALALHDKRTNETVIELGYGYGAHAVGTHLSADSITHQILASGQPYLNNAVRDEPQFAFLKLKDVRAFAGAPLIGQGEPIGALWINRQTAISQEDLQLLVAVADRTATAIRRAMLHEQTQEQARQLQHIMNTVPEGLLLLNEEARIVQANSVAQDYLALLTDANVGDILTRLGERPLVELLEPVRSNMPWHELELLPTEQIFEITAHMTAPDSLHSGWLLMLRDVTQERRRQQYLQTQERLATVGQLAAGIAHDFNNIMAVITLYSQMLLASPGFSEKVQQRLTTIHKQANRAADLIRQIMDFSRHSNIERRPVILIPFMKEVVKLLNRSLLESINVRFVEPLEGEYVINADPTRLQQVIMNLAVNARDAMPRGGMLEITLDSMGYGKDQPLPLPDMTPGKWIRMAFSDTGAGISADDLPHIFEPFFTTKSVGQGTGLGLAQVHGIVKQHDGAIAVKSRPGKGTTFTIYLPALIETTPTIRETGPLSFPRSNSGGTVLVVDDNPETLEAVREALEILEYEVMSAHTGQEALTIIDVHQDAIDLVLTDLIMPGMSGVDLYRTLQDRYPALKIMIMSGYPRDKAGDELLEAEEVAWLQKPISIQILAQKVRQMFA